MNLGTNTLGGVELAGAGGAGAGAVPPIQPILDVLWHDELAGLYRNAIERERRLMLGNVSSLGLYTQRGATSERRKLFTEGFNVFPVATLGGPEEWVCELAESVETPWAVMREITEIRVNTHGHDQIYKVISLERPIGTGHVYRMRLQAINDPRV